MEIDGLAVGALLASQALHTLALLAMSRQVKRATIMPPPPPLAALPRYCINCGALSAPADLRGGLCPSCLGRNPTERPYDDPHAAAIRRRRSQ